MEGVAVVTMSAPWTASSGVAAVMPPTSDARRSAFFDHEEVFGDIARSLSVRDLRRAIGYWEQQVNYPEALRDVKHQEGLRSLFVAELMDGMGDIKGTL